MSMTFIEICVQNSLAPTGVVVLGPQIVNSLHETGSEVHPNAFCMWHCQNGKSLHWRKYTPKLASMTLLLVMGLMTGKIFEQRSREVESIRSLA